MSEAAEAPRPRVAVPGRGDFGVCCSLHVRNRDTDQFGHVNHAAMATLFEESRINLILAPEHTLHDAPFDIVIASLNMAFVKELKAPSAVDVTATVGRIGSSSLDIRQAIFQGEVCYAFANSLCVLIERSTRRPTPAPQWLRDKLLSVR